MPIDKHVKRAARDLAQVEGISYTAARRKLSERPDIAVPPMSADALAAASTNLAAGYDESDWSFEARAAFEAAARLQYWEERRAGRAVRLWEATIEVLVAASSPQEARWLLYVGYLHRPCHRVAGLYSESLDQEAVSCVPDHELQDVERERLISDYPARPMRWSETWEDNDEAKAFDVDRYVVALRRAAARARGEEVVVNEDPFNAGGVDLQIYATALRVNFLDTPNLIFARRRAAELAATIPDHTGLPLGRVVAVMPDDGDLNHHTLRWDHPAAWDLAGDLTALWDDFDAASSESAARSLPNALDDAARRLHERWNGHRAEIAASNALRHLHPNGSRTLATPQRLAAAVERILARHADSSPEDLAAAATEQEYFAHRVLSKAIDTDADEIRFEIARSQATALRARAGGAPRY